MIKSASVFLLSVMVISMPYGFGAKSVKFARSVMEESEQLMGVPFPPEKIDVTPVKKIIVPVVPIKKLGETSSSESLSSVNLPRSVMEESEQLMGVAISPKEIDVLPVKVDSFSSESFSSESDKKILFDSAPEKKMDDAPLEE